MERTTATNPGESGHWIRNRLFSVLIFGQIVYIPTPVMSRRMGIRPGGERGCPGGHGQSSVIGVVLILGLVITSMTVIATVGGLALLDTEADTS
jgi:hypothetical protein